MDLAELKMGDSDNYLMQKQLEMMMEGNNRKIAAEMNDMKSAIIQLNDEVQQLKAQVHKLRTEPESRAAPGYSAPSYSAPAPQQQAPPQDPGIKRAPTRDQAMAQTSDRPKFTEFTEDEVSISSVFYAGRGGMAKKR